MKWKLPVFVIACGAVVAAVAASGLKDKPLPTAFGGPRADRPGMSGPPEPLVSLPDDRTLGEPFVYANLAVYPVLSVAPPELTEYLTLDEALAEELIEVSEKEDAEVSTVLVTNHADLPLYIMAGEVILGGKQDRVVAKDTIVPSRAEEYPVRVFCVEPRRWTAETGEFEESNLQASTEVRKAAQLQGDQSQVWAQVAAENVEAQASPATGTYRAGAVDSQLAEAAQDYVEAVLAGLAGQENVVGMVVALDGRVLSADVYASPSLFRKLQRKLLTAHAREAAASAQQGRAVDRVPAQAEVAQFLEEARQGREVAREEADTHAMRQLASPRAVGFQTVAPAAAGGWGGVLHENYYANE